MTLPIKYWTLRGRLYSGSYEALGVVSVRHTRQSVMVYARDTDDRSTYATAKDCHGEYPTLEDAQAALARIDKARKKAQPGIDAAEARLNRLRADLRQAIKDAL